uniref:F-box domain-containing protein n=1 Tax=Cuerna arida TaxID=1464854 RepID=A0A1B6GLK2_9HEMI
MESSTEVPYSLEDLPLDIIESIAHHITVEELAACCAVSHRMRETFGENALWRRHCDQELAEYLRTTPCKVDPSFVSPEIEDSTLSPICYWRMAFMRETHLRNNWIQGKFKKECLLEKSFNKYWPCSVNFLTNDIVMVASKRKINVLDVRHYPAVDIVEPIYYTIGLFYELEIHGENNIIYILYSSCVQVYYLEFSTKQNFLKYVIFFEDSLKLDNVDVDYEKQLSTRKYHPYELKNLRIVQGKYFVGILPGELELHVWDLEKGVKLRKEILPIKKGFVHAIRGSFPMIIIAIKKYVDDSESTFIVYNIISFCFLPFRITGDYSEFYVHNDIIEFWRPHDLTLYNAQTSEIILTCLSAVYQPIAVFDNKLLFVENCILTLIDCDVLDIKHTLLPGVISFNKLSRRFIQIEGGDTAGIWIMNGNKLRKTMISTMGCGKIFCVNKLSTRSLMHLKGNKSVIHYW